MQQLTGKQEEILDFIANFQDKAGRTPTGPEIADAFGYGHAATAYEHLRRIEKKGYLEIIQEGRRKPLRLILSDKAKALLQCEWAMYGRIPAGPLSRASDELAQSVTGVEDLLPMVRPDDYFLTVEGDSMVDAGITEGMLLLMRPTDQAAVKSGAICAVHIPGDGGTLKRVFVHDETVRLVAENDTYPDEEYPAERVHIQGVLVAALDIRQFS